MERDPMDLALSTDVVMDIVLSHLKVIDLLSCRLTSKFWNKAASSVLRKRSTMIKNIPDEEYLLELENCMKTSSDFPFAGLKFDEPWTLNSGLATKFFEDYGTRFTRLCLDTHCTGRLDVLVPFIHHLPRLSVLEMARPDSQPPHPPLQLLDSDTGLDGCEILNLASLRTLRIFCPLVAEDILGEVVMAASSSLQIECLNTTPQIIGALERAGKLRAVSFIIKFDEDYANRRYKSEMEKLLSTESPSLTKLDCDVDVSLSLCGLEKILFSSQHTLKEFHLDVTYMRGELVDLWNDFPVLAKLTTLTLRICIDSRLQDLFQGLHGHKFPALKEFKLVDNQCDCNEPATSVSNCQFIVPSVTKIDLKGYVSEHVMEHLAQVFPNVTDIRLEYGDYYRDHFCGACNFMRVRGQYKILSFGAFKCVERFRIWNYKVQQPWTRLIEMDSFLTGIPAGICTNLRQHEQLNLINSPWNELSRTNPNILQLKNLKELIICLKLEDGLDKLTEDPPFMSMVSVWYALEMMPNLRAKFTYEVSLPRSSHEDERYKTVLEAALKHVRPYVTLEPFFY